MVTAWRSPGSTLKPFLYGLALDDGLIHAESLLQDVPRRFGDYRPGNFDTGFHGPVSASEALARSLNLPAVQLLEAYGPKRFAANLRNVGVELRLPAHAEPSGVDSGWSRRAVGSVGRRVQRIGPARQSGTAAFYASARALRSPVAVAGRSLDCAAHIGGRSAPVTG